MSKEKKIKILLLTVRADHGGGPKHIYLLLKTLSTAFDFFVACPKEEPYFDIYVDIVGEKRVFTIPHRKFNIFKLSKLKHIIKKNDINIIHSHGKGAGIYGRLLSRSTGTISIHTFHGIHLGEYNPLSKFLYLTIERYLSKFTNKFICVSESERDTVISLKLAKSDKILIIHNGVELTGKIVNSDYLSKTKLKIVTISRFDYAKNSELLIPIFNKIKTNGALHKFEIQLIGSGPEQNKVRLLAEENELSGIFKFLGFKANPIDYLIDSFCYISTSRWEGLPLGIMEAMSVGLPVIATKVDGNNDLVKHSENGYLFDINKPEEAAFYLLKLSENKEKWKQFSENAKSKIEKEFTVSIMAEKTKQLYLSIRREN